MTGVSSTDGVQSVTAICLLLLVGSILRAKVRLLSRLYLPVSVIAGSLGLLIIQVTEHTNPGLLTDWTLGWTYLAGFLININFACLFLGNEIPPARKMWESGCPQFCYGLVVNWGQHILGIGVTYFFLSPVFGVNRFFGIILPIGFEGGHGTAASLKEVMYDFDFEEGESLGLASATVGLLGAVTIGMTLVNLGVRKGWLRDRADTAILDEESIHNSNQLNSTRGSDFIFVSQINLDFLDTSHLITDTFFLPVNQRPQAGLQSTSQNVIDCLTLHIVAVSTSIFVGLLTRQVFVSIENLSPTQKAYPFFDSFPLFPFAMIGGILVRYMVSKTTSNNPCTLR